MTSKTLPDKCSQVLLTKSRGQLELSSIQHCGISFHQHVQEQTRMTTSLEMDAYKALLFKSSK